MVVKQHVATDERGHLPLDTVRGVDAGWPPCDCATRLRAGQAPGRLAAVSLLRRNVTIHSKPSIKSAENESVYSGH